MKANKKKVSDYTNIRVGDCATKGDGGIEVSKISISDGVCYLIDIDGNEFNVEDGWKRIPSPVVIPEKPKYRFLYNFPMKDLPLHEVVKSSFTTEACSISKKAFNEKKQPVDGFMAFYYNPNLVHKKDVKNKLASLICSQKMELVKGIKMNKKQIVSMLESQEFIVVYETIGEKEIDVFEDNSFERITFEFTDEDCASEGVIVYNDSEPGDSYIIISYISEEGVYRMDDETKLHFFRK